MKNYYVVIKEPAVPPKTRHYLKLPSSVVGGIDSREPLSWPKVLIIEETEEGFFINRYHKSGKKSGDTWHQTLDDAVHQIKCEYGDLAGDMIEIPQDVKDLKEHALKEH